MIDNEELKTLRDELMKSEERMAFLSSLIDSYADLVKKQIDLIRTLSGNRG